jgi:hypothetical protein
MGEVREADETIKGVSPRPDGQKLMSEAFFPLSEFLPIICNDAILRSYFFSFSPPSSNFGSALGNLLSSLVIRKSTGLWIVPSFG